VIMDKSSFERMVTLAVDTVPERFRPYLETVQIVIEPEPSRAQRRALGLKPRDTLYGLYEGLPAPDRTGGTDSMILPSVVTIFRRALAADYPNEDDLRAEVRRTVLHELAHHFGIDDDRLEELDAY